MTRSKVNYANVVATIALFVALGGGAYAATQLPTGSVGSRQLKKNAVNSAKVENHSLRAADFRAGQLPAGPMGPKGDIGPRGEPGATQVVTRSGPDEEVPDGGGRVSYAACEPDETVTGGGYNLTSGEPATTAYRVGSSAPSLVRRESLPGGVSKTTYSRPADGTPATGWSVFIRNQTGSTMSFQALVMCASH
jgi:hypothetical protein